MSLVPHTLLFQTRQKLSRLAKPPGPRGAIAPLGTKTRLHTLATVDGVVPFAELRMGWHPHGLQIDVSVSGKKQPPKCDPKQPLDSDGLQLWIDTRNTPGVHRANRFCQLIVALPAGAGVKQAEPFVRKLPIPRCREASPEVDPALFRATTQLTRDGYTLRLWLPASALAGYDPEASPILGFFYAVRDAERGEQTAGVSREFPFTSDPSLWQSLELTE